MSYTPRITQIITNFSTFVFLLHIKLQKNRFCQIKKCDFTVAMSSRCSGSDMMQLFQGFCGVILLRLWCHFSGMTAPSQCNNIENSMQQEHHRNGTVIVSQRKNPLPTLLQGFCHCCHLAVTV